MQLGTMHAASFVTDPKHLGFVLARYKFVAKMLTGYGRVLEIGCGDCTGAAIVNAVVGDWRGFDRDHDLLNFARTVDPARLHFFDITSGPFAGEWDACYALDVLEHISPNDENAVLRNITECMTPEGVLIIGMPSKESQPYASELSRLHHVNCKTEDELRETMKRHFHNVFMFGMNDETLHTGYGPMCHYRLAIGVGKR